MRISSIQLDIGWENKEYNYKKAEKFLKISKKNECSIAVFPEMFNVGFSMNVNSIAERSNSKTTELLIKLAKKYDINIIAGFPEKNEEGKALNNALIVSNSGDILAKYTKNHPFSFAKENEYYKAGNEQVLFNIGALSNSKWVSSNYSLWKNLVFQ